MIVHEAADAFLLALAAATLWAGVKGAAIAFVALTVIVVGMVTGRWAAQPTNAPVTAVRWLRTRTLHRTHKNPPSTPDDLEEAA